MNRLKLCRNIVIFISLIFALSLSSIAFAKSVQLLDLRMIDYEGKKIIVFEIDNAYKVEYQIENSYLLVTFKNIKYKPDLFDVESIKKFKVIRKISNIAHENSLRFQIGSLENFEANYKTYKPQKKYRYRFIIELNEKKKSIENPTISENDFVADTQPQNINIIIDPGHGGHDSGAVYRMQGKLIKEKQINLQVSQKITNYLKKIKGINVVLTRTKDNYLTLNQRVNIGLKREADLFLSVHANYISDKNINGIMLFTLSNTGVNKTINKWRKLIEHENRYNSTETIKNHKVLLDLDLNTSLNKSQIIGDYLLDHIETNVSKDIKLFSKKLQKGNFAVLRNPKIPSLLLEMGFLSNKKDLAKLVSSNFQDNIAKTIAFAIIDYFSDYPPSGSYFEKKYRLLPDVHIVSKGENLTSIARKYQMSINKLTSINNINLSAGLIYPKQKLKLKFDEDNDKTNSTKIYRVKKGDSLSQIAQKFGLELNLIKHFNNLSDNHIYIGQKLYLEFKYKIYVVLRNDNLYHIATKFNTTIDEIVRLNKLQSLIIHPGQKIRID